MASSGSNQSGSPPNPDKYSKGKGPETEEQRQRREHEEERQRILKAGTKSQSGAHSPSSDEDDGAGKAIKTDTPAGQGIASQQKAIGLSTAPLTPTAPAGINLGARKPKNDLFRPKTAAVQKKKPFPAQQQSTSPYSPTTSTSPSSFATTSGVRAIGTNTVYDPSFIPPPSPLGFTASSSSNPLAVTTSTDPLPADRQFTLNPTSTLHFGIPIGVVAPGSSAAPSTFESQAVPSRVQQLRQSDTSSSLPFAHSSSSPQEIAARPKLQPRLKHRKLDDTSSLSASGNYGHGPSAPAPSPAAPPIQQSAYPSPDAGVPRQMTPYYNQGPSAPTTSLNDDGFSDLNKAYISQSAQGLQGDDDSRLEGPEFDDLDKSLASIDANSGQSYEGKGKAPMKSPTLESSIDPELLGEAGQPTSSFGQSILSDAPPPDTTQVMPPIQMDTKIPTDPQQPQPASTLGQPIFSNAPPQSTTQVMPPIQMDLPTFPSPQQPQPASGFGQSIFNDAPPQDPTQVMPPSEMDLHTSPFPQQPQPTKIDTDMIDQGDGYPQSSDALQDWTNNTPSLDDEMDTEEHQAMVPAHDPMSMEESASSGAGAFGMTAPHTAPLEPRPSVGAIVTTGFADPPPQSLDEIDQFLEQDIMGLDPTQQQNLRKEFPDVFADAEHLANAGVTLPIQRQALNVDLLNSSHTQLQTPTGSTIDGRKALQLHVLHTRDRLERARAMATIYFNELELARGTIDAQSKTIGEANAAIEAGRTSLQDAEERRKATQQITAQLERDLDEAERTEEEYKAGAAELGSKAEKYLEEIANLKEAETTALKQVASVSEEKAALEKSLEQYAQENLVLRKENEKHLVSIGKLENANSTLSESRTDAQRSVEQTTSKLQHDCERISKERDRARSELNNAREDLRKLRQGRRTRSTPVDRGTNTDIHYDMHQDKRIEELEGEVASLTSILADFEKDLKQTRGELAEAHKAVESQLLKNSVLASRARTYREEEEDRRRATFVGSEASYDVPAFARAPGEVPRVSRAPGFAPRRPSPDTKTAARTMSPYRYRRSRYLPAHSIDEHSLAWKALNARLDEARRVETEEYEEMATRKERHWAAKLGVPIYDVMPGEDLWNCIPVLNALTAY